MICSKCDIARDPRCPQCDASLSFCEAKSNKIELVAAEIK